MVELGQNLSMVGPVCYHPLCWVCMVSILEINGLLFTASLCWDSTASLCLCVCYLCMLRYLSTSRLRGTALSRLEIHSLKHIYPPYGTFSCSDIQHQMHCTRYLWVQPFWNEGMSVTNPVRITRQQSSAWRYIYWPSLFQLPREYTGVHPQDTHIAMYTWLLAMLMA